MHLEEKARKKLEVTVKDGNVNEAYLYILGSVQTFLPRMVIKQTPMSIYARKKKNIHNNSGIMRVYEADEEAHKPSLGWRFVTDADK